MKQNQFGRSMIEMLGVLAIIAVLSVGGIAGYSKAIQKFKLNKWKEDFIALTINLKTAFISEKNYSSIEEIDLTNFFKELNIIPNNMITVQNRDIFGNMMKIYTRKNPEFGVNKTHFTIQFKTFANSDSVEECKILFELLQNYEDGWIVTLNEDSGAGTGGSLSVCGKILPKTYAQKTKCVSYDLALVSQKCSTCSKNNCDIKFAISNGN